MPTGSQVLNSLAESYPCRDLVMPTRDTPSQPTIAFWSRPGLTMTGHGLKRRFDPGVGPNRYERALRFLRESGSEIGFASFTFDPEEPGSVVLVPETVVTGHDRTAVPAPAGTIEDDDADLWRKMVNETLVEIEGDRVEKVVLSRRITAIFDEPLNQMEVATHLVASQPDCHVFAIDGLVGASPELLIRVSDKMIESFPLAGSATTDPDELRTEKNINEHRLAADSVESAFAQAGLEFTRGQPQVVRVGNIRHMGTRFRAHRPVGFEFSDILRTLHPTAAVAGTPRVKAIELIRDLEGSSRGRYSGPVGWFNNSGEGEFAVALRCGLLSGRGATFYSGAGIVAGSDPDAELEETDWKLEPMIDATGLSLR